MIELYFGISITFAYVIMANLENLRHMPKKDIKSREKLNKKIIEQEEDLKFFLLWPWLIIKKTKNEFISRK